MIVVVLYALALAAVFFSVYACWSAISIQGKLNTIIEAVLRIESVLRLLMQKEQS